MAKYDYSRPLAAVNRLFVRYGQTGKIRRVETVGGTSYDPGEEVVTDHDADMVVTDYRSDLIDGSRIRVKDKRIMVAPGSLPFAPEESDKVVEADGTVYNIVPPIETKRPAGTTLVYIIQGRR